MPNTKEEWKKRRNETAVGIASMFQGIDQLRDLEVLTAMEVEEIEKIQDLLKGIASLFNARDLISKETYCDRDNR